MGCDIHMYVERKRHDNKGNKWYCADYFVPKTYELEKGEDKMEQVPLYDGRNYQLFATLANVRNYGGTDYIDDPRGLPEDCCEYVKEQDEYWGVDGHSHSYFTLKELIDFKNTHLTTQWSGMIDQQQKKALEAGIVPETWCQWTSIEGYEKCTWETKNDILDCLIERLKDRADDLYIIPSWYWGKNDEKGNWGYNYADKIRIVFWFDN